MPDLRLGNVFHLPSRRISRRWTRRGTNLVIFLEAFCAQTNLFWREMKINNIYYIDTSVLLKYIPLVKFIKTTSGTRVVYFP